MAQHIYPVLRYLSVILGFFHARGGGDAAACQFFLPASLAGQKGHALFKLRHFALGFLEGRAGEFYQRAGGIQFGLGLFQGKAEGGGVKAQQHGAGGHARMVAHQHFRDAAGNFGGNLHDIGADIGVFGGDVAPAGQPKANRHQQRQGGHAHQQHKAQKPALHGQ